MNWISDILTENIIRTITGLLCGFLYLFERIVSLKGEKWRCARKVRPDKNEGGTQNFFEKQKNRDAKTKRLAWKNMIVCSSVPCCIWSGNPDNRRKTMRRKSDGYMIADVREASCNQHDRCYNGFHPVGWSRKDHARWLCDHLNGIWTDAHAVLSPQSASLQQQRTCR